MTVDEIPLTAIGSLANFVLLGPDGELISEHQETASASRALARHAHEHPNADAAIYRRRTNGWELY